MVFYKYLLELICDGEVEEEINEQKLKLNQSRVRYEVLEVKINNLENKVMSFMYEEQILVGVYILEIDKRLYVIEKLCVIILIIDDSKIEKRMGVKNLMLFLQMFLVSYIFLLYIIKFIVYVKVIIFLSFLFCLVFCLLKNKFIMVIIIISV